MTADAELLQLGCELLSELGVENYEIRLNNRKVLSGLMAQIGVARGKAENGVLQTIDKLPKVGEEKTRESLRNDNGLDDAKVQTVCDFLGVAGDSEEVLKQLRGMFSDGVGAQGVEEVTQVFDEDLVGPHGLSFSPRRRQFFPLADVGRERDDLTTVLLLKPPQNYGGVESSRIGEHDAFYGCHSRSSSD